MFLIGRNEPGSRLQNFWCDEMEKIRVFLGDSWVIFREGMHFILEEEDDVEVVGEGRTIEESLTILEEQPVDVLVLSQDLEDVAYPITERTPSVGLVLIGNAPSQQKGAIRNSIVVSRDVEPEELAGAIRKASKNNCRTQSLEEKDELEGLKQSIKASLLSLVEAL